MIRGYTSITNVLLNIHYHTIQIFNSLIFIFLLYFECYSMPTGSIIYQDTSKKGHFTLHVNVVSQKQDNTHDSSLFLVMIGQVKLKNFTSFPSHHRAINIYNLSKL